MVLCESIKIKNKYKIKSKTQKKINEIAVDGLMDGIKEYDWNNEHYVLTPYIKKYVRYYLFDHL